MSTPTDKIRAALESLIKYAEWQMSEGSDYHPTLRSAVGEAKEALSELDGMVLVPVEPTADMLIKGQDAYSGSGRVTPIWNAMIAPYVNGEKK